MTCESLMFRRDTWLHPVVEDCPVVCGVPETESRLNTVRHQPVAQRIISDPDG